MKSPLATILVCDDEPALLRATRRLLERGGHRVLLAGTPDEALEIAEREAFDLLLTDVVMPGMKGTELAVRVRQIRPHVPVLFMSGYNMERSLVGEVFLEKPFQPAVLLARIAEMLGTRG